MVYNKHMRKHGFTIVELLVVIIVISVLVALSIVGYSTVTQKASLANAQSDLSQVAKQLESYKNSAASNNYPTDLVSGNIKTSALNTIAYYVSPAGSSYCAEAVVSDKTYSITSANSVISTAKCINNGLTINLDAADSASYPGSGATWINLAGTINGTLLNGPTFNASDGGGTLVFDGLNDYTGVDTWPKYTTLAWTPSGIGANQSLTIELWFKSSDSGYLYSKPWNGAGEYNFVITPGQFSVAVNPQVANINYSNTSTGSWTQLVCWVDGTKMGYFVNGGSASGSKYHSITNNSPANGHTVRTAAVMTLYPYGGAWAGDTGYSVGGSLAVLKAYNRVLSASEVTQNFNAFRGRYGI